MLHSQNKLSLAHQNIVMTCFLAYQGEILTNSLSKMLQPHYHITIYPTLLVLKCLHLPAVVALHHSIQYV